MGIKELFHFLLSYGTVMWLFFIDLSLYPVARWILPKIKSRKAATLFHLITGLLFQAYLFKHTILYVIAMAVVCWFLIGNKPALPIAVGFAFNVVGNIWEKVVPHNGWSYSCNSIMMIVFHKILATAMNCYYGQKIKRGETVKRDFQRNMALESRPNFIEWLAYIVTPFGGNSGPQFEFKVFELVLETGQREQISADSEDRRLANERWVYSIFWALVNIFVLKKLGLECYDSKYFVNAPFILKPFLVLLITTGLSTRYFCAWYNVEAAFYQLGLGSCGICTYEDVSNSAYSHTLSSISLSEWLQRWNHCAHLMWKRYLMYPLLDNGIPYTISHHSIFVASAFWHGFEPVFYLVLPEMLAATRADILINEMWPVKDRSFKKTWLRRLWVIAAMYNNTSTWWYRTTHAFFYVRQKQKYFWTVVTFAVWIWAEVMWRIKGPSPDAPSQIRKRMREQAKKEAEAAKAAEKGEKQD